MNTIPEKTLVALRWIVSILNERNIPYEISGGFAAKLYGSSRELNDIDIDVPESELPALAELVQPYITDPLSHYQDGKWDLDVMTLNYQGQEIDIGGAYDGKVSNKKRTAWIAIPSDLSKAVQMEVGGIAVNVMPPDELIAYKQHLDGDHQNVDIAAARKHVR